jgi:hypothetical protein
MAEELGSGDNGLWGEVGRGLQNMGEVLSPAVFEKNAIERREAIPNMLRKMEIAKSIRAAQADQDFQKLVAGKTNPGMTSTAMMDAVKEVDPYILSASPAAHQYMAMVAQRQAKETAVENQRLRLQAAMDKLNKPQEHVVNGKLLRSYADGRTEIVDLPAPTTPGGSTRFSISPKDYTPESLKKYAASNNVGDLIPVKGAATDNLATPGGADFTKTGDDFLTTLPAPDRVFVKKLANYDIDPKTLSTRGGEREKYLKLASQFDPSFDQKEYNTRYNAINRFATGRQGDTARSISVAIEHMDTARKLGAALQNGDTPAINKLAQMFAEQTGKAAPTNFDAVKEIVADEVVKGVIGGAGALADREAAAQKIKRASSPAQLNGVLDSWTELLGGQLKGLERQYEAATKRKDFRERVTPRALEAINGKGGAGAADGKPDPLGIRG